MYGLPFFYERRLLHPTRWGALGLLFLATAIPRADAAGLNWPADHLLPAFPPPAATLDCVELPTVNGPEADLFASLEGIVNRTQPRLTCIGRRENQLAWLKIHRLPFRFITGDEALAKYKDDVTGLVVTDPNQPDTLDLATTLAGLDDELICAPSLLPKLTNAPFHFQIKEDLRGKFSSKRQVYEFMLTNCWPRCTHRVIAGMALHLHGNLRDYLVAVKAAVVWLDPRDRDDAHLLAKFVSGMKPADSVYMGWWPDEESGLTWIGRRGIPVLASDFYDNGSVFSGVRVPISPPPIPPTPPLQNKVYVAFFLSDGDNVQYMQHRLKQLWSDPARGQVPIGWTVSPLTTDLDPAMLNYYWTTATTNDCLVSGPSGAAYARLNFWRRANLDAYTKLTEPYLQRSGLRIITVWMRVTHKIGRAFAANCPALLGLISHEGGSFTHVYQRPDGGALPAIGLVAGANYASNIEQLRDGITKAARHWNGTKPLFIAVQGSAWNITPTDLQNLATSLDTNKFVVVRPDHLFQLLKLARKVH